jgi:hypothetical protein
MHYQYFAGISKWNPTVLAQTYPSANGVPTLLVDRLTTASPSSVLMSDMVYYQTSTASPPTPWMYNHGRSGNGAPVWDSSPGGHPATTCNDNLGINILYADSHADWRVFSNAEITEMNKNPTSSVIANRAATNFY